MIKTNEFWYTRSGERVQIFHTVNNLAYDDIGHMTTTKRILKPKKQELWFIWNNIDKWLMHWAEEGEIPTFSSKYKTTETRFA